MTKNILTCVMCGSEFDAAAHSACQSCPLQKGCNLVCCPNCGYETVNVNQSVMARIAARFLPNVKNAKSTNGNNLAEISPRVQGKVIDFDPSISTDRKAHLQAYGLIPGNSFQVIRHSPVTIVQIGHTELALENSLARMIQVERID